MKIGSSICLKPSNDRDEFELDRARSTTITIKNSFAPGHVTDNRYILEQVLVEDGLKRNDQSHVVHGNQVKISLLTL